MILIRGNNCFVCLTVSSLTLNLPCWFTLILLQNKNPFILGSGCAVCSHMRTSWKCGLFNQISECPPYVLVVFTHVLRAVDSWSDHGGHMLVSDGWTRPLSLSSWRSAGSSRSGRAWSCQSVTRRRQHFYPRYRGKRENEKKNTASFVSLFSFTFI